MEADTESNIIQKIQYRDVQNSKRVNYFSMLASELKGGTCSFSIREISAKKEIERAPECGRASRKYIETRLYARRTYDPNGLAGGAMLRGDMRMRREMRLQVLNALPPGHQHYFFSEIRKLCRSYMSQQGSLADNKEAEAMELVSEVVTKLLGATSLSSDEEPVVSSISTAEGADDSTDNLAALVARLTIDHRDPRRDGRIAWLVNEVGGPRAISHRYEDMRRQRWGRWQPSRGRRFVQIGALTKETAGADGELQALTKFADGSHSLHEVPIEPRQTEDVRQMWLGLIVLAQKSFRPDEDSFILLQLLSVDPHIQEEFGAEWPISLIVDALNVRHPIPPWNDDRVENAKRRLLNLIGRLKRDHGLDQTDLEGLLARIARQSASYINANPDKD